MTQPSEPRTKEGRALLASLASGEYRLTPEQEADYTNAILAIEAAAAAPDPAPDPLKWQWYGDWPEGVRHGAGEGWLHVHPDGTRWVHPEKVCEAAAPDPVATPLDVERLARALIGSDLMPRYREYAMRVPTMDPSETVEHLAAVWAGWVAAAYEAEGQPAERSRRC